MKLLFHMFAYWPSLNYSKVRVLGAAPAGRLIVSQIESGNSVVHCQERGKRNKRYELQLLRESHKTIDWNSVNVEI